MHITAYIGNIVEAYSMNGAIVNAAKPSLEGGGGVDGAIHAAAGPELLKSCIALSDVNDTPRKYVDGWDRSTPTRCRTGDAVITPGHDLDVAHIIHTVAPVYKDDSRVAPALLASCYRKCLDIAEKVKIAEITFPAIGTGIYGYPLEDATVVAVNTVLDYYAGGCGNVLNVNFVCFDAHNLLVYRQVIEAAYNDWYIHREFE